MLLSLASSTKPHAVQKTSPPMPSQLSEQKPSALTKDSITLKGSPQFGNRLLLNHGLKYPRDVKLNFEQAGQAQHALVLKCIDMAAKNDKSHLLFSIQLGEREKMSPWTATLKGLADSIPMFSHPIDTIVEKHATVDGLRLLQSATGKRYMNQYAHISFEPPESHFGGYLKAARARLRLFNEDQRDIEWLIMNRSGNQNREAVFKDLHSTKNLNALSSLAYGEKGLVDAVIIGNDHLLTRPSLEKYYTAHQLAGEENREKREQFNQKATSMASFIQWAKEESLLETFNHFAPNSISEKPRNLQKSVLDKDESATQKSDSDQTDSSKPKPTEQQKKMTDLIKQLNELVGNTITSKDKKNETKTRFHFHNEKFDKTGEEELARSISIQKDGKSTVTEIQHVPVSLKQNTFIRDSILFPCEIDDETGEQALSALDKLYEKKTTLSKQGKSVSNALIVANSPGGDADVTGAVRSRIESSTIPTDVIIQGWGSSGGSILVSVATGNRFATPSSSILLHEARTGELEKGSLDKLNHSLKGLEVYTAEYKQLIAEKTGRPYKDVDKDFKLDFDINAVESILYGKKGLIDAILVGPNKVLTRDAIMDFIIEKKGSAEAAQNYIDKKFIQRREGKYTAHLDQHKSIDEDPLANPLQVIHELVQQGKAVPMGSIERFKASLSDVAGQTDRSMHLYKIAAKPPTPEPTKK
jgi:ATP-dependent protease ClpP protease subunit